uniref:Nonstructural protein 1 n=1 Tax=Emberiza spodocephala parvoviridae sp. TaxID=2794481 RepID=A0A8A4XDF1_9VIRU|nr:MAG: nonstructural protein 1 [Emberiza spodocephala parvoviridae sp.]
MSYSVIDEVGDQCQVVETVVQYGQDTDAILSAAAEKAEARLERREAGYESSSISDSTSGDDRRSDEEGGRRNRKFGGVHGWVKRTGDGNGKCIRLVASEIIPEFFKVLDRGQRRVVRESVTFNSSLNPIAEIEKIHRSLQKKGTVYAIARHDEPYSHYHIVHACPWNYYCCRCYSPGQRRRTLRTTELDSFTTTDWYCMLIYLSTKGRYLQYLCSGLTSYKRYRGIEFLQDVRLHDVQGEPQQMEDCNEESENAGKRSADDDPGQSSIDLREPTKKVKYATSKVRYEDLETFMMQHATVPLQSITNTNIWQGSAFRFIDADFGKFRSVLNSIRKRLCTWTIEDFKKFYDNNNEIRWEAINSTVDDYYYSIDESKEKIYELLHYQMKDFALAHGISVYEMVKQFMNEVFDICEKRKPKMNTLELTGPAGSGKSWFADMITAYYLNVGHARNWNKNENFPLQSCVYRRIILWNEAQVEQSAHDSVKLLLGGDPCPANVKYLDTQTIPRTPILITANAKLIPNTEPFNQRMIRYTWLAAPFLKFYTKKPHPLAYQDILEDFNYFID